MQASILLHDSGASWTLEPSVVIPLLLSVLIYGWGIRNAWWRAGVGHGISIRRSISFIGAILTLVVTLISPLDSLSDDLFSAHMTQHLLLMIVAAPLLIMSDFPVAFLWALPRPWAQATAHRFHESVFFSWMWRVLNNPVFVWILFTLATWLWHAPRLYQAALLNERVHILEHLTFFVTGMLFWWILLKPTEQKYSRYGMLVLYLFTTVLQSGILGALITFSSRPWYSTYTASANPWGITPLQDQQVAGLIMWILGGAVFTLLTIGYFAAWLDALEQRSVRLHSPNVLGSRHEVP